MKVLAGSEDEHQKLWCSHTVHNECLQWWLGYRVFKGRSLTCPVIECPHPFVSAASVGFDRTMFENVRWEDTCCICFGPEWRYHRISGVVGVTTLGCGHIGHRTCVLRLLAVRQLGQEWPFCPWCPLPRKIELHEIQRGLITQQDVAAEVLRQSKEAQAQSEEASECEAEEEPRTPQNEPQEISGEEEDQAQPPEESGSEGKEEPDEPRTPPTEPPQNEPEDSDDSVEIVEPTEEQEQALVAGCEKVDPNQEGMRRTNDQVQYALWLVGFFEVRSSRNTVNAETVKAGYKHSKLSYKASHSDKLGKTCARDIHDTDTADFRALHEAGETIHHAYKWGTVREKQWKPYERKRNTRPKCVEGLKEREVARMDAEKLTSSRNVNDFD